MDFIVTISGDAAGPFDIYYDTVSVGTLVDSGVTRSSLLAGYSVTIAGSPASIIVVNTDTDCQNSQVHILPTPTPTPTPVPTITPTPTPTAVTNCTLFGLTVSLTANATPTPTPTSTPTRTPTPTPTPTPTGTIVIHKAEIVLNDISPSNVLEVSNSTVGGSISSINVSTSLYPAYGINNSYITSGVSNLVVYRVRKTSPSNTAADAGSVFIQVNGIIIQSFNFNLGDVIDFYFSVNIVESDLVSIQIWEG